MPYADYSPQEIESRGEAIYQQRIRRDVEAGNKGRFVVIDIDSGDYEIDDSDVLATKRLLDAIEGGAVSIEKFMGTT